MTIYKPAKFFCITFLITSLMWFAAAYISLHNSFKFLLFPLIFAGMAGPSIAAYCMLTQLKSKNMWQDFYRRLSLAGIKPLYILFVVACMPVLIACAILISLLFGQSMNQFSLSQQAPDQVLDGFNYLGIVLILFLSCAAEEIGWRGYGIDSLRVTCNLWQTSLIFATLWSLWHVPAFFIHNGYFQQELWNLGVMHVAIYFASLFPLTILMNWVYVKNNRNVVIVILFHMAVNISYSLFKMQLPTKMILMILLWMLAGAIVAKSKTLFF